MRGIHADGKRIKQLRKAQGLTQEKLAALATCDTKTIRKAEQGKNLDYHALGKLATVLGAPFSEVVDQRDDPQSEQLSNTQLVELWNEAFSRRDIAALMTFFHDDAVFRAPGSPEIPFGGEFRGTDEIRRMIEVTFATAETEPLTRDRYTLHAVDDYVFLHGTAVMKSKETGVRTTMWAMHMLRIKEGKIMEVHVNYDALAMHKALQPQDSDDNAD